LEEKFKILENKKPREGDTDAEALAKLTKTMEESCKQVQAVQNNASREGLEQRLARLERRIEVNRTDSSQAEIHQRKRCEDTEEEEDDLDYDIRRRRTNQPRRNYDIFCHFCKRPGHKYETCRQHRKQEDARAGQNSRTCKNCGLTNHATNECHRPRNTTYYSRNRDQRAGNKIQCQLCEKWGHDAKTCNEMNKSRPKNF